MAASLAETFATPLVHRWRGQAEEFRSWGAAELAEAIARCANDLDQAEKAWLYEELLLSDAAREFRWTARYLRDRVRAGDIQRVPSNGPVRVRRIDMLKFLGDDGTT